MEETKAGRRHSQKDMDIIEQIKSSAQGIIQQADELGATPDEVAADAPADESAPKSVEDAVVLDETAPEPVVEVEPEVKDENPEPAEPEPIEVKTTTVKVRAKTDDLLIVGGYGVVFGGMDLTGDTFEKSTNFFLDVMDGPRPVLYEHGFDDALDLTVLGKTVEITADDYGLWVEAQLNRHTRYMEDVEKLIEKGILGWSSGSAGHLVRRTVDDEKSLITSWPILEFSLTPTPAEPRTLGVQAVRSVRQAVKRHFNPTPDETKALTLDDQADVVEDVLELALAKAFPDSDWGMSEWEREMGDCDPALYIYDSYAVAQVGAGYYRVPYTIANGEVMVSDQGQWQRVDMNWTSTGDGSPEMRSAAVDVAPEAADDAEPHSESPIKTVEEEELDMSPEELQKLIEDASTKAAAAAVAQVSAMYENQPPLKTAGVAVPNINIHKDDEKLDELKAFRLWMAYGSEAAPQVIKAMRSKFSRVIGYEIGDTEMKATLGEANAPGAYWVPTGLADQILLPLANWSYLRRAGAAIMNNMVGYDPFNVPVLTFSGRASIGGESSQYVPDEPGSTQVSFVPWKLKKAAKATEELVSDSRYDVWNMILRPDYEQSFAEGENYYFTLGTGTGQPQGVVAGATVGVTASSSTAFTSDELISLFYSVDPKYRADPSFCFMANDSILKVIRQMKDGYGDYIWTQGFGETPDRILGKPVIWNNQMSSSLTTGQTLVLAGAMRYYWISDWPGLQIQRLNELYAETGEVGFRAFRRLDGHIMQAAAFRTLKLA